MRSTTTTAVDLIKLGVLGVMSVVCFAPSPSVAAGQTMMATINPVDTARDQVEKKVKTAEVLKQIDDYFGKDKTDVAVEK